MRTALRWSVVTSLLAFSLAIAGETKVEKIDAKAAAALAEKGGATIIDVREEEEVTSGMAKPAKWFPLTKVRSDPAAYKAFLAKQPKGKLVFYCAAGKRAGEAAEQAAALGYSVANMGGMSDWEAAGLPTKPKP